MPVVVKERIKASTQQVWKTITDIENSNKIFSAIIKVNVLNRPSNGLVGFKWQETRVMFGKEATETMTIDKFEEGKWYETLAFNSGCEYRTRIQLLDVAGSTEISISFNAKPIRFAAKLLYPVMSLFNGMISKALKNDLAELKAKIESNP